MSDYWASSLTPLLRDPPPESHRRSAYEVEINPWSRRGDVEAALLFRGSIVSAYGYIESTLGELCVRASRLPSYAALRESFPHSADQRISFLRRAFAIEPLLQYQLWAGMFFDRLDAQSDLRNLAAHSRMQVMPDWGVTFHDLRRDGPSNVIMRRQRMTMSELETEAWRAARLSRLCQMLVGRLNRAEILPVIE
ncbi:hypothetical protein SKP52_15695 [Sphingopyxis fribergensis]|uniref:Uncharacterized protein n=1 Tax=Sphingopyxis fribergensis TaxID=1515612 RepID=A0A0A7PPZ4_9SPHN|nr:hypothetical protein [Sphingopyxis fribergensis]AJA10017.1 hypothetical protein SKP52_15695 [Sphingopyxis fribergensis]